MSESMTKDEARKFAREDCVKHYILDARRQNRYVSEEAARAHINGRADVQDKRRDWKETGIKK